MPWFTLANTVGWYQLPAPPNGPLARLQQLRLREHQVFLVLTILIGIGESLFSRYCSESK